MAETAELEILEPKRVQNLIQMKRIIFSSQIGAGGKED